MMERMQTPGSAGSFAMANPTSTIRRLWARAPVLAGGVTILGIVAFWHFLASSGLVNTLLLPTPEAVLSALAAGTLDGSLLRNTVASLNRVVIGFVAAIVVGVPFGLFLGRNRIARQFLGPVVEVVRPIPPIAWIPLAILWFGIGSGSAYFIVFLAAFFPIFTNAQVAANVIEPIHINAARCLGAPRKMIVMNVIIPSALPVVLGGIRTGLGISWMAVVAAELVAAQSGLGYWIALSRLQLQSENVVAGMIAIGVVGVVMMGIMGWIERRLTPWREGN
jgi:NitT/TauT family transport system permease protein/sulfonate transport system permease protein